MSARQEFEDAVHAMNQVTERMKTAAYRRAEATSRLKLAIEMADAVALTGGTIQDPLVHREADKLEAVAKEMIGLAELLSKANAFALEKWQAVVAAGGEE